MSKKKYFFISLVMLLIIFIMPYFYITTKHKNFEGQVIEYLVDKGVKKEDISTKRLLNDRQGNKKYEVYVEIKGDEKKYYYVPNKKGNIELFGVEGKDGVIRTP